MNEEKKYTLEEIEETAERLSKLSVEELAEELKKVEIGALAPICRALDDSEALAEALLLLPQNLQEEIIDEFHEEEIKEVAEEMSLAETVDLIEDMPPTIARKLVETEEIRSLLSERKFSVLKPVLAEMNEFDLAEVFNELSEKELPILFRLLPKDLAASAFVELDRDAKEGLLKGLYDYEIKTVVDELFLDDTVDLIEEMPANVVKRLLAQADRETRVFVNEILKYPKDSAGSIMTVEYVSLHENMTVGEAFQKIRQTAIDKETIYTSYVTDEKNKLLGVVTAKTLLLSDQNAKIGEIMEQNVIYSLTSEDRETVARKISDYGFLAIPIVDMETRLVGIVTVDDALDVLQGETTEDIAKMAATAPSDKPYLKTSVFALWKNRFPWLLVLMLGATFTGLILNVYEARLNAISTALFACVPMMMGTGGNSGSQASVTVIRSLSLGEVKGKDFWRVIWKEFRASILLGVTLAVACFAKLLLIDRLLFGFTDYTAVRCFVVSLALLITVVIAKVVGGALPIIAKKCKLDPAVVASPFITTIVDALSLIVYCALAVQMLG